MKRTFIAIKIEAEELMLDVLNACREELINERIRWVQPDKIHITLKFLGDTSTEQLSEISNVISDIAGNHPAFSLTFKGMGIFGKIKQPRVLWMGIERNPVISEIKQDLDISLQVHGFEADSREFRPHLTLGRIKNLDDNSRMEYLLSLYKDMEFQVSEITDMIFYESILKPTGPEYIVLSRMQLL